MTHPAPEDRLGIARSLLLRASESERLRDLFQRRGLARGAVRRFMPGESMDAALEALRHAATLGIGGVLTHLGENIHDLREADAVVEHYLRLLDAIDAAALDAQISVKLTQLGLDVAPEEAERRLARLAAAAETRAAPVWIDMEGSAYTDRTLALYRRILERHGNVGLCLQAYLRRTESDLDDLLPRRARIRLVKGAYQEPASIAFAARRDVDHAFLRLATALVRDARSGGAAHAIATHDLALIDAIRAEAAAAEPGSWEIHMLYGIRSDAQRRLAGQSLRVRVLVSYGDYWYPWFVRRLAERPANVWFVLKALVSG